MNRNTTRFYLIGLAAVFVVALLWNRSQQYPIKPRAAGTVPAAILMDIHNVAVDVNGQQNVVVTMQTFSTANKLSGFETYFNLAGAGQITAVTNPVNADTNDSTIFTQLKKDITATQASLSYVSLNTDDKLPATVKFTITVKGTGSAGVGTLSVDTTKSQIVGNIADNTYYLRNVDQAVITFGANVTPTPTTAGGNPTATPTSTTGGNATPTPTRTSGSCTSAPSAPTGLTPNGNLDRAGFQPLGWDTMPGATSYELSVQDIGQGWINGATPAPPQKWTTGDTGLSYTFLVGHSYKWSVVAINSCGRSAPSEAYVYVQTTATPGQPGPGTGTPTPTVTSGNQTDATPTPTATPGMINVSMSVRFQGIVTQPATNPPTIEARLTMIRNRDREHPDVRMTKFTYDKHGVWVTTEQYQMYPTDGVTFFIEPEKHLQRRICDERPTDLVPYGYHCGDGNGQIVLHYGDNNFDFTRLLLYAGDIPFKGENDGVIDAYDISYIRTHLGQNAPIADLNYDGVTDTQDYQLAIAAMQIQRHDEY